MVVVIDPQIAGVSGDMLLCSLVDMGADKDKIISGIKESAKFLPDSRILKLDFKKIQKHGIQASSLVLEIAEDVDSRKGSEIKDAIINSAKNLKLSEKATNFAQSCIDTLICAESKIHGVSEDSVHLHEASSVDTLVDIIGVAIALDDLRFFDQRIVCLPISVGSGSVTFSHGTMSNPSSAVLEILKNSNLKICGNDANEELATPTGVCILVNLTDESANYYPALKVDSLGYGAGQKDFDDFSNVLKLVCGTDEHFLVDCVKILQTNVDDVSGEILGNLIEKIMQQGARDVSIYPGITKKGRPTNLVSVICDISTVDAIADILVSETGTLGIRVTDSDRFTVPRSNHNVSLLVNGESFEVNYKKSSYKGAVNFKIEFEDLKQISNAIGKSIRETEILLREKIKLQEGKNVDSE